MLVVGASMGGLHALQVLLSGLPETFPLTVAVVQHRHRTSDNSLGSLLQKSSKLPVSDAEDKEEILAGHVYLAPPDYHLMVNGNRFALSVEDPVNYSRPSIDVLFETAADTYGERLIGVIMTGANRDGACGLRRVQERGGLALVQDPKDAEAPAMPEAAIQEANVDRILPLAKIAPFIVRRTVGGIET